MYLKYLFLIITISACSSQVAVKSEDPDNNNLSRSDSLILSRKAQEHFIKGNIFELKGNYAEAILEYQEALQFEDAAGIHYALSNNYIKLNKLSKSLSHAKDAVERAPGNVDYNFLLAVPYPHPNNHILFLSINISLKFYFTGNIWIKASAASAAN